MDTALLEQIKRNLSIEELNEMQLVSASADLNKYRKVMLLSPTGSGKTLAVLLMLQRLSEHLREGEKMLMLVPSRELAVQIDGVCRAMKTSLTSVCCYGGNLMKDEKNRLRENPLLVVGTPGRLIDHFEQGTIDAESIRCIVMDEFDKCLELGFRDEMAVIFKKACKLKNLILLSATDASEEALLPFGGKEGFKVFDFYKKVDVHEHIVISPEKDKLQTLYDTLLYIGNEKTIVFLNYREAVERVSGWLTQKNICHAVFHGGMEQKDREKNLYKFKNGSCDVLVSTDLASRGLDIDAVDNIVHYHLPLKKEIYLHRNGRTGRWDRDGNSYAILSAEEKRPEWLGRDIPVAELPSGLPLPQPPRFVTLYLGKGKKDKISKADIVGFLIKKAGLDKDDIGLIAVKKSYSFVAVKRAKCEIVIKTCQKEKIKGVKTFMEVAS